MASLKAIRTRIGSVKNTQKITKAMKLVAAARLRRAQDAITAARPYAESLERVVRDLGLVAGPDAHPLLQASTEKKRADVLLLTSDKGLAGAFNSALIRGLEARLKGDLAEFDEVRLRIVGRKGNDHYRRREATIESHDPAPTGKEALDVSRDMANRVTETFLKDGADAVFIAFNRFRAPGSQEVTIKQLLPVTNSSAESSDQESDEERLISLNDFLYEPSKKDVLEQVLPLYVQVQIFRAILESIASELGSRMAAMDAATRNAGELIDKLTLTYNRARQAAITTELTEIVAGAESLKG